MRAQGGWRACGRRGGALCKIGRLESEWAQQGHSGESGLERDKGQAAVRQGTAVECFAHHRCAPKERPHPPPFPPAEALPGRPGDGADRHGHLKGPGGHPEAPGHPAGARVQGKQGETLRIELIQNLWSGCLQIGVGLRFWDPTAQPTQLNPHQLNPHQLKTPPKPHRNPHLKLHQTPRPTTPRRPSTAPTLSFGWCPRWSRRRTAPTRRPA